MTTTGSASALSHSELGEIIATFPGRRWPWWASVVGIALGALSILFALDGDYHIKKPGALAAGVGLIVLSIIGPPIHRRLASWVVVHRDGLRVGRGTRWRSVRWRDVVKLAAEYRIIKQGSQNVPAHRMTIEATGGTRLVLDARSCGDVLSMMRTVEEVARLTLQPVIEDTIAGGIAIAVGRCHVVANGWMVNNTLLPWNALQAVNHHENRITAELLPIGTVDLGPYADLPLAWSLLHMTVDKARTSGASVRMFDDVPLEWN